MVNEEVDEDNDFMGGQGIKNPQKYEALLEKKKERRTVTLVHININNIGGVII